MSQWGEGLKPIAVITRKSHQERLEKDDAPPATITERRTIIIDGKIFMIRKCSKLLDCDMLFPIKHRRSNEDVYSCAYDCSVWKFCPKTRSVY